MSNMSYCRFQNTSGDFRDCVENLFTLDPEDSSHNGVAERCGRASLIRAAANLLEELSLAEVDTAALDAAIEELDAGEGYQPDPREEW